jgi:hypothetical protein
MTAKANAPAHRAGRETGDRTASAPFLSGVNR